MPTRRSAGVLALVLLLCTGISAQVPRTLSFSGVLKTSAGRLIDNPAQQITVGVYSAATGGTALYSETLTVAVSKGLFSATIGQTTALPTSVNFITPYWIGVKVAGDASEMTPRIRLGSVPYASGLTLPIKAANPEGTTGLYVTQTRTDSTQPAIWGVSPGAWATGIFGEADGANGTGLLGVCYGAGGYGVYGQSSSGPGVYGSCASGTGTKQAGVYGTSSDPSGNGVVGEVSGVNAYAIWGSNPNGTAARFDGNVYVSGTIRNGSDQAVVGVESLRIIRGIVDADGSRYRGTGFTSSKTSTGTYHIVWTTPFSDIPTMTVTPNAGGPGLTTGELTYPASADVWIGGANGPANYGFQFIAIGPK